MRNVFAYRLGMIDRSPYFSIHGLLSIVLILLLASFLISCAPSRTAQPSQVITAFSTSSAQPWMVDLFACAEESSITVKVTAEEPDISLRIGEPEMSIFPAYQIDEVELLIVSHRESQVRSLSIEEVRSLFAGAGDPSVQVWVYPSGLDMQRLFDQAVMQGRGVTSSARVAVNPNQMSEVISNEINAVGILSRSWAVESVREIYSLGRFPVLAVLREEAQGAVKSMIVCLQND